MAVAKPQAIAHGWIVLPNRAQTQKSSVNTAFQDVHSKKQNEQKGGQAI